MVAPLRSAPLQASIALTSACDPPYSACQPSPSTCPSLTTTAPTTGLGCTRPRPRVARSIARDRWLWSVSVLCTTLEDRGRTDGWDERSRGRGVADLGGRCRLVAK